MMTDDRDARIAQLESEVQQLRQREAALVAANAALHTEAVGRDRALSEALEQQTATAEVLRVIASSPTDVQTVLAALVASVAQLANADGAAVSRLDGDEVVVVASVTNPANIGMRRPATGTVAGRALSERRTVQLHGTPDHQRAEYPASATIDVGYGTMVAVPLLSQGEPIGTLNLARREIQPFADREVALIETFADQAVIAIENARLFEALAKLRLKPMKADASGAA